VKCIVNLSQGEFMYAESVDQYLEGDAFRLWEQQRTPWLSGLGACDARIDNRPRALLEHHRDAKITADLEALGPRHRHQQLPRGKRTYGLTDLLFGRHLVKEIHHGIDCDHLGKAVATERHWASAHQMQHRID
jgi:hypothetical protein